MIEDYRRVVDRAQSFRSYPWRTGVRFGHSERVGVNDLAAVSKRLDPTILIPVPRTFCGVSTPVAHVETGEVSPCEPASLPKIGWVGAPWAERNVVVFEHRGDVSKDDSGDLRVDEAQDLLGRKATVVLATDTWARSL